MLNEAKTIFTMADSNTETLGDLLKQLGSVLGVGKRSSTGRYHIADMFQAAGINKWAKYKPFRYNSYNFNYDPANPSAAKTARDNARKLANQGFVLTNARVGSNGSVSDIESKYDGDMNGWVYSPPRGTSTEPNRIRDFDGYNHSALPFIGGFSIPSRWAKEAGSFTVAFRIQEAVEGKETDYITHLDFDILENAYMGIALIGESGNRYRMTADDTIGNGVVSFTVPTNNLAEDDYTAYPFFSSKKLTFLDSDTVVSTQYTVPNVQMAEMVLVDTFITMTITAIYLVSIDGTYTLSTTITVYNNSGQARTLKNNTLRLRYASKAWSDALVQNEQEKNLDDITIAAGGSYTINKPFTGVPAELARSSKLWVSLNSAVYLKSVSPMAPAEK